VPACATVEKESASTNGYTRSIVHCDHDFVFVNSKFYAALLQHILQYVLVPVCARDREDKHKRLYMQCSTL
jgi:hypothetical protein